MERLKNWISVLIIVAAVLSLAIGIGLLFHSSDKQVQLKEGEVVPFKEGWQTQESEDARQCILSKKLPSLLGYGDKVLAFQTNSTQIVVRLDGEEIYTYGWDAAQPFHIPFGQAISCVNLPKDAGDKTIEIEYTSPVKPDPDDLVKSMYLGDRGSILFMLFKQNIGVCIFGIVCFLISLIFFAIAFFISAKSRGYSFKGFLYLGLFVLLSGIWVITDSIVLQFFVSNVYLIFMISFISFMLMPICLCLFLRETQFHSRKALDVITFLMLANMLVCLLLHFTGLIPLTNSILSTHALLICLVVTLFVMCIRESVFYRNPDVKEITWGLLVMSVTAVLSIILFYFNPLQGYSLFFRYGILLFIFFQGMATFRRAIALLNENAEANFYKRLAYIDVMTRLNNRSAFEKTIQQIKVSASASVLKERYIYVLFDINNLKETNDIHGHQTGDKLIIRAAECILEAFRRRGEGYRIGGDEFVVIMKNERKEDVNAALAYFKELVDRKNQDADVPLNIAWGYAIQEESNMAPEDLIKRADANMYKHKEQLKAVNRE